MMQIDANEVVAQYTGLHSVDRVLLNEIHYVNESLISKYSKHRFYEDMSSQDKEIIQIRCMSINAERAFKIIGLCASVGFGVGIVVGAICANAPGAAVGGGIGFVAGGAVGIAITYEEGVFQDIDEDILRISLHQHKDYKTFKENKTKEQYALYMNAISNYADFLTREEDEELKSIICPITCWIPEIPVFSPHDVNFLHPFDKAAIETVIDMNLKKGNTATNCPFKGPTFGKSSLVYNVAFAKKVIRILDNIQKNILARIDPNDDPLLQEALTSLIQNYKENYNEVTVAVVDKLSRDAFKLGKEYSQTKMVCDMFLENFKKA